LIIVIGIIWDLSFRLLYHPGGDWWGSSHRLVQERCAVRSVLRWSRRRLFCLPCYWPDTVRETGAAALADRADSPDSYTWYPCKCDSSRRRKCGCRECKGIIKPIIEEIKDLKCESYRCRKCKLRALLYDQEINETQDTYKGRAHRDRLQRGVFPGESISRLIKLCKYTKHGCMPAHIVLISHKSTILVKNSQPE
jgi:hypothetical protein